MKQVVCREDIQAEMDIFRDMQYKLQMLQSQVSLLQDRVDLLEAKARIDVGMGTPINAPTRTGDTIHSYWGEGIPERIRSDGHWVVNDDQTITYVRDGMPDVSAPAQWTSDGNWNDIPNSNTN